MADLVGASYKGLGLDQGAEILVNSENVVTESATVAFTSSGEFKRGLTLKNGGAGDVKNPYANSDTIAEVSGECILAEPIVLAATAGGQETVKVLTGGNVKASKVLDRDGNEADAAFRNHADMTNVRFVHDS